MRQLCACYLKLLQDCADKQKLVRTSDSTLRSTVHFCLEELASIYSPAVSARPSYPVNNSYISPLGLTGT